MRRTISREILQHCATLLLPAMRTASSSACADVNDVVRSSMVAPALVCRPVKYTCTCIVSTRLTCGGSPYHPDMAKQPDSAARFITRFNEALDEAGAPRGRGRRPWVASVFGVTYESARKWLAGEAYPTQHEEDICKRLNLNLDWLRRGAGPKRGNATDSLSMPQDVHVVREQPAPTLAPGTVPGNVEEQRLYQARLAWNAFAARGAGLIASGDLNADDVHALAGLLHAISRRR